MSLVLVPARRVPRWVDNFATRHGRTDLVVSDAALVGRAEDGSHFTARLPFAAGVTAGDGSPWSNGARSLMFDGKSPMKLPGLDLTGAEPFSMAPSPTVTGARSLRAVPPT